MAILIVAAVGIGAVAIALAMRPRQSEASPFDVFKGLGGGSPGMTTGPQFSNIRGGGIF